MIQELITNLLGKKVISVFDKEEMKARQQHYLREDEKWARNPTRPRIIVAVYITVQMHTAEPRFILIDGNGIFYDYAQSEVKLVMNKQRKKTPAA